MTTSRARLLSIPLVAVVALAACGDDDSSSGSSEEWCSLATRAEVLNSAFDDFETTASDPESIEAAMTEIEDFLGEVRSAAPSEIADDVETLADGTDMLVDALRDANFNILDTDLSFMADDSLADEMDAAGDRIDAYTLEECGQTFGSDGADDADTGDDADNGDDADTGDDDFDPSDGSLREQLAAQFESLGMTAEEAACVADNIDPAFAEDTAALLEVMEECGISLERLAEIGGG